MNARNVRTAACRAALAAIVLLAGTSSFARPARVGKLTTGFTATLDTRVYSGTTDALIPGTQAAGRTLVVRGTYAEFAIDLDTLTVSDYTLTGAAGRNTQLAGRRTAVFSAKVPEHGTTLTSDVSLRIANNQIVVVRAGAGQTADVTMKVTARDTDVGDALQMESSRAISFRHEIAPGFEMMGDQRGGVLLVDGPVVVREAPEPARLSAIDEAQGITRWKVPAGGRVGTILGEGLPR